MNGAIVNPRCLCTSVLFHRLAMAADSSEIAGHAWPVGAPHSSPDDPGPIVETGWCEGGSAGPGARDLASFQLITHYLSAERIADGLVLAPIECRLPVSCPKATQVPWHGRPAKCVMSRFDPTLEQTARTDCPV